MAADLSSFIRVHLGDVTEESTVRLSDGDSSRYPVYGVDRSIGLTSEAKYASESLLRYKLLRPGMFAYNPMRLNIGSIGYCTRKHSVGLVSPDYVVFECKNDVLLPDYLAYAIKGDEWTRWTQSAGVGSVRVRIYYRELARLQLTLPSLPEQEAIANMLGMLDEKIELNRQMNETLEGMARAIFKSWFVDFDPVHAKAKGRRPETMDTETAKLFPSSFQDSEIGPVPKGWRVGTIKELTSSIQYGFTSSATGYHPDRPHFLRITDIQGGRIDWNSVPYCDVSQMEYDKYEIRNGDVFVARTGASTGENVYVCDPPRAVFASYLVRFQFADPSIARYVSEFMRSPVYFEYVAGVIGGTAQPNASAQALAGARVVIPSINCLTDYYGVVHHFDMRQAKNQEQSRTLATLRNALLPKLLSGEFAVPVSRSA